MLSGARVLDHVRSRTGPSPASDSRDRVPPSRTRQSSSGQSGRSPTAQGGAAPRGHRDALAGEGRGRPLVRLRVVVAGRLARLRGTVHTDASGAGEPPGYDHGDSKLHQPVLAALDAFPADRRRGGAPRGSVTTTSRPAGGGHARLGPLEGLCSIVMVGTPSPYRANQLPLEPAARSTVPPNEIERTARERPMPRWDTTTPAPPLARW